MIFFLNLDIYFSLKYIHSYQTSVDKVKLPSIAEELASLAS